MINLKPSIYCLNSHTFFRNNSTVHQAFKFNYKITDFWFSLFRSKLLPRIFVDTIFSGVYIFSKNQFPPPLLKIIFFPRCYICLNGAPTFCFICWILVNLWFLGEINEFSGEKYKKERRNVAYWCTTFSPSNHLKSSPPPPSRWDVILKNIHPCNFSS